MLSEVGAIYDGHALIDCRVAYILQIEIFDRATGIFFDEFRKQKLDEGSMSLWINDHAEMNGRGFMGRQGLYLYPNVLSVPFVIRP
jgi:hypothetical protein